MARPPGCLQCLPGAGPYPVTPGPSMGAGLGRTALGEMQPWVSEPGSRASGRASFLGRECEAHPRAATGPPHSPTRGCVSERLQCSPLEELESSLKNLGSRPLWGHVTPSQGHQAGLLQNSGGLADLDRCESSVLRLLGDQWTHREIRGSTEPR